MNFQCAVLLLLVAVVFFSLFHRYAVEYLTTLCNTLDLDEEEDERRRLRDVNKSAARV